MTLMQLFGVCVVAFITFQKKTSLGSGIDMNCTDDQLYLSNILYLPSITGNMFLVTLDFLSYSKIKFLDLMRNYTLLVD